MELSVEKGTKEGEAFQALQEKHSQVLANCQKKLKSLVMKAGDINLVKKKKLAITSFVESVNNISEGFLTYDDRKEIDAHQCSIDAIKLYSDHLDLHLNTSKEILLKEYKKSTNSNKCPGPASPTPWQQPLRLLLLLLTLLIPKTF